MKDGALVRGGYSVGCICDDETVICHGDAWLLSSLSTTQVAFRPVIDVTEIVEPSDMEKPHKDFPGIESFGS